jgi:ribosomal protein S12 methylthiotransferase
MPQLLELFQRIRTWVPGAAIRTTLIVGFPGETDADFQELLKFVEQVRFDHMGVFTYSDAEDLASHRLPGHIPKKVAQFRHDTLMARQVDISANNLLPMVGATIPVMIENSPEPDLFEGRSMLQAPEVDGMTIVRTQPGGGSATVGEIVSVTITDTLAYDLIGRVL